MEDVRIYSEMGDMAVGENLRIKVPFGDGKATLQFEKLFGCLADLEYE